MKGSLLNYVNPNFKDNQGNTPLHLACTLDNASQMLSISALLKIDAVTTVKNNSGSTPLHELALSSCTVKNKNYLKIAQLLFQHKARVEQRDHEGTSSLHMAIFRSFNNNSDFISYLLQQRADINAQDNEGNTPLHYAVSSGHVEGVQVLLKHGANKNVLNKDGYPSAGMTHNLVRIGKEDRKIIEMLTKT